MGLCSRKPKANPKITVDGIEIAYHSDHEWWEFDYRGLKFCAYETSLILPAKHELDWVVESVESLKPELRKRLVKGLAEWSDAKVDDGESCSVNLGDFTAGNSFSIGWSDGVSWGDLGVEFAIKNGQIVDESWGD